jgi:hypothetical protein
MVGLLGHRRYERAGNRQCLDLNYRATSRLHPFLQPLSQSRRPGKTPPWTEAEIFQNVADRPLDFELG